MDSDLRKRVICNSNANEQVANEKQKKYRLTAKPRSGDETGL